MQAAITAMKKYLPRLNRHAYKFDEVYKIAKRNGAIVEFAPYRKKLGGYYQTFRKGDKKTRHIIINSNLNEIERTFAILHEFSHDMLHEPVSNWQWLYCGDLAEASDSKKDCEANVIALMAMIPLSLLNELERADPAEIDESLARLCIRRRQLQIDRGL